MGIIRYTNEYMSVMKAAVSAAGPEHTSTPRSDRRGPARMAVTPFFKAGAQNRSSFQP